MLQLLGLTEFLNQNTQPKKEKFDKYMDILDKKPVHCVLKD